MNMDEINLKKNPSQQRNRRYKDERNRNNATERYSY